MSIGKVKEDSVREINIDLLYKSVVLLEFTKSTLSLARLFRLLQRFQHILRNNSLSTLLKKTVYFLFHLLGLILRAVVTLLCEGSSWTATHVERVKIFLSLLRSRIPRTRYRSHRPRLTPTSALGSPKPHATSATTRHRDCPIRLGCCPHGRHGRPLCCGHAVCCQRSSTKTIISINICIEVVEMVIIIFDQRGRKHLCKQQYRENN
mmetsp:Transcript_10796/g.16422  ORF Transcript_10796/g.16422 Transcript_10796/m.16422 type:complete len:207 (-) Transcript_10796:94-714(-)